MADFSLSNLGFAKPEEQALQAVLTLSERALTAHWVYIPDSLTVDVVLVSLNSPKGIEFWEGQLKDYPSVCFVACVGDSGFESPWKLTMSPTLLPSRRELIELLNALSGHIASRPTVEVSAPLSSPAEPLAQPPALTAEIPAEPSEAPEPEEVSPAAPVEPAPLASAEPSFFEPGRHFLGVLQLAIASDREALFALPGHAWLAVSPRTQSYYCAVSTDGLLPLLRANAGEIQVRDLNIEKMLVSPMGKETKALPLQDLVWHAALAASDGRLLAGCEFGDVVRLRRWPPVAHLPSYRKFLRLAAFMNHNAVSLDSIPGHTNTPLSEVLDFHNACEALGLLERHVSVDLVKKPTEGLVKDLYRKISSRLARSSHEDKAS